jgi:hypothetical protein
MESETAKIARLDTPITSLTAEASLLLALHGLALHAQEQAVGTAPWVAPSAPRGGTLDFSSLPTHLDRGSS